MNYHFSYHEVVFIVIRIYVKVSYLAFIVTRKK